MQPPYTIEPNNNAVMRETLYDAYLYRRTWTVIHFIELQNLVQQGTVLTTKINKMKDICLNANQAINTKCNKETILNLMEKRLKTILNLQNDLFNSHSRKKRGLFNFVGEAHKFLWGSLSSSDLDYLNTEIDKLYKHTNESILLQEKQIRITQNGLKDLENDFEIFNNNMIKLENWVSSADRQIEQNHVDNLMTEAILELEIVMDEYKDKIETFSEGILHARSGHLSPSLMPPSILIESLTEIQKLDTYTQPTFNISTANYPLIMKISEVVVYLNNTRLVVLLKVPIAKKDVFLATKFTPLPQHVSRQNFRLFRLPDITMFITKDKTQYALERNHLHHCLKGFKFYYCKLNGNIFNTERESNCETDIINNKLKNCDAQYFELLNDYYIALNSGNQWYIAPAAESSFQIVCSSDKFISSFFISQNSILTLREDCIAKNEKTSFIPSNNVNYTTIEIPKINDIDLPSISEKVLPQINLNLVNTKPFHKHGLDLDEINKQLDILRTEKRHQDWYHTSIQWLNKIGYICIFTVIIYLLYRINALSALFVCFKGLFTKFWNSICFRQCHIYNYQCSNVNISDRNESNNYQVASYASQRQYLNSQEVPMLEILPIPVTRNRF